MGPELYVSSHAAAPTETMLLSETRSSRQKPWGKAAQLLLSRRFTFCWRRLTSGQCGVPVPFPSQPQGRLPPRFEPLWSCLTPACPWGSAAFGWKKQRFMTLGWSCLFVHHYTELPQTDLVCPTPALGRMRVFQMGLNANLHSCTFSSSFPCFLETSTCCQFACSPLLVELMPFCYGLCVLRARQSSRDFSPGNAGSGWLGAASPTRSSCCWPRCRSGGLYRRLLTAAFWLSFIDFKARFSKTGYLSILTMLVCCCVQFAIDRMV